jgi:PAS domain S-box-containing protein
MENVRREPDEQEITRLTQRTRELEQLNETLKREIASQRCEIESLRRHDPEFDLIVNSIPVPVAVTTPSGEVESLNQATLDYFGKTLEELKGWTSSDVVHPDDLERTVATQRAAHLAGRSYNVESRHRRADGVYRWFNVLGLPLRDQDGHILRWFVLQIDIDDRKRVEEALRAQEREAQLMIDSIPVGAAIAAPDGSIENVNKHMLDYFGCSSEELKYWMTTNVFIHPDDFPHVIAVARRSIARGEPRETEQRLRRSDGVYRWFQVRVHPQRGADGSVVRWHVAYVDIDDRKRAEEVVAKSERNLRETINTIPTLAWCNRTDGSNEFLNQKWHEYTGLTPEEANGWGWQVAIHPDDLPMLLEVWRGMLASGQPGVLEARLRRHDGVYRWFLFRCDPLRDASGTVVKWYGTNSDIDDLKRAEEALRSNEHKLNLILNTIPTLIHVLGTDGSVLYVNQGVLDYTGLTTNDVRKEDYRARLFHAEDLKRVHEERLAALKRPVPFELEMRTRGKNGSYRWFLNRYSPLLDEQGTLDRWYATSFDIEDRKRAESELRRAYDSFSDAQQLSHTGSFITDLLADDHKWSDEAFRIFEFEPGTKVTVERIRETVHRDDLASFDDVIARGAAGADVAFEFRIVTRRGALKHVRGAAHVVERVAGRPMFVGALQDVTESKLTEDALRRSEAFLAEGQRLSQTGTFTWRTDTDEILFSEELYRIFEIDPKTVLSLELITSRVHPLDAPLVAAKIEHAQTGGQDLDYDVRLQMPGGRVKHLHTFAHSMVDRDGRREILGAMLDITQRRLAEEALDIVRSELAHAARAMSLGVLTASIAHEINQPLSGIITNANTCLRMLAADPPNVEGARKTAQRTIRDGNRASDIVARLRALFSKKTEKSEEVDLNDAASEVIALAASELQRNRVALRTDFARDLPFLNADRVQLQQVILNLLLNASDAMSTVSGRQRLAVVRTTHDSGGVRLSVQDAGVGFPTEDAERLFQAFYTTKSNGMGIGLSVSRSIIETHHGRLWCERNTGPGATFSFSIPINPEERQTTA